MISIIEKLFNKTVDTNYTISDYSPHKSNRFRDSIEAAEYMAEDKLEQDEMQIDRLHEKI